MDNAIVLQGLVRFECCGVLEGRGIFWRSSSVFLILLFILLFIVYSFIFFIVYSLLLLLCLLYILLYLAMATDDRKSHIKECTLPKHCKQLLQNATPLQNTASTSPKHCKRPPKMPPPPKQLQAPPTKCHTPPKHCKHPTKTLQVPSKTLQAASPSGFSKMPRPSKSATPLQNNCKRHLQNATSHQNTASIPPKHCKRLLQNATPLQNTASTLH